MYQRPVYQPQIDYGRILILQEATVAPDPPTPPLNSHNHNGNHDPETPTQDGTHQEDGDTVITEGDPPQEHTVSQVISQRHSTRISKEIVHDSEHIELVGKWFAWGRVNGTANDGMRKLDAKELREHRRVMIKGMEEGLSSAGQLAHRFGELHKDDYLYR